MSTLLQIKWKVCAWLESLFRRLGIACYKISEYFGRRVVDEDFRDEVIDAVKNWRRD